MKPPSILSIDEIKLLQKLDRAMFIDLFQEHLDYKAQFGKLKTALYIELGVRPETGSLERQLIRFLLDDSLNFKRYAELNMQEGDIFYLINKRFID
jgi:hypothetical protein